MHSNQQPKTQRSIVTSFDLLEAEEDHPARNYVRPFIAAGLVLILVISAGYAALRPWLQSQATSPPFDAVILAVAMAEGGCTAAAFSSSGALAPSQQFCVCGQFFAEDSDFQYVLRLRTDSRQVIHITTTDGASGLFCHLVRLSSELELGRYEIEISHPQDSRALTQYWFSVIQPQSSRSPSL